MAEKSKSETSDAQAEADALMAQALEEAQASVDELRELSDDDADAADGAAGFTVSRGPAGIELLSDVDLDVSIELGRTHMLLEDVLKLASGSVVELNKLAGDPVDVYVNNRLVARGEVLVLNDNFCIRISEIVADLAEQAQAAMRNQSESGAA